MIRNLIRAQAFDPAIFQTALTEAAGFAEERPVADQVEYLARYAKRIGAATVVREDHYIDRHFLDEHAVYYGRALEPPPNSVTRFHLFATAFSDDELGTYFERAAALSKTESHELQDGLSRSYLGFITIRPIPAVPVGRTVLRRVEDGTHRDIWATSRHPVHLANLSLSVEGIAFQQQDLAVGACATAALWSALSVVSRREGMRAPTPAEVSTAAGRHVLTHGRTMPAVAGFTTEQIIEAIRSCGFAPEAVRADERPEFLVTALHTYLLSGIPVVIGLEDPEGQHAVTAVGFQSGTDSNRLLESSIPVRSARIRKLYIHDDRLGPYARAFLLPLPRTEKFTETLMLQIETDREDGDSKPNEELLEDWIVESAVVPVYPKLRLSVRSLITLGEALGDLIEACVGPALAAQLGVEFYYDRAGSYLAKLNSRVPSPRADFFREVALPRWCGVVRWFISENQLAEFVYDTTDILRDQHRRGGELLRAVVCFDVTYRPQLASIANYFNVPFL